MEPPVTSIHRGRSRTQSRTSFARAVASLALGRRASGRGTAATSLHSCWMTRVDHIASVEVDLAGMALRIEADSADDVDLVTRVTGRSPARRGVDAVIVVGERVPD